MILSNVGEIYDSHKKIKVEWKIPHYLDLSQKTDTPHESPAFSFHDKAWNFIIYPNGERGSNTVGWINLYIKLKDEDSSEITIRNVKLGIKSQSGKIKEDNFNFTFTKNCKMHGRYRVLERVHSCQDRETYTPNGVLTVVFEAETVYFADTASQTSQNGITLLRHLSDLLKNGRKSDVVIQVSGRRFQAHKLVLGTRSPVFAAMFEHNMKENKDGVVKIVDCEPDTFQKFLEYMYTGEIENFSCCKVVDLLDTADKYSMVELKERCMEFVKRNLSAETACETFVVADRHNEIELRQSAKKLILQNFKKIVLTDQWKKLLVENYPLSLDLLVEAIPDN